MCGLLVQNQARSRGKGSRADAKADAWKKGEQALFCQSPGGALTACELGNGTWNVPFPDRLVKYADILSCIMSMDFIRIARNADGGAVEIIQS